MRVGIHAAGFDMVPNGLKHRLKNYILQTVRPGGNVSGTGYASGDVGIALRNKKEYHN